MFQFFQVDTKFYLDARLPADSCLPLTIVREARSEHFASCDDDAKCFDDIDEQIDGDVDENKVFDPPTPSNMR